MNIELILVPFDVEKDDTALARSPCELKEMGLGRTLEERGASLWIREVGARKYEDESLRVTSVARAVSRRVSRAFSRGRFPLIVSGGCLAAVGVAVGLQRTGRDFTALWFDAHGDFNTPETTPSGYWDGMALSALSGRSLPQITTPIELKPVSFSRIVHLGGRALDDHEAEDFDRLSVLRIGPDELEERWHEVDSRLGHHCDYYLHIDVDALDPDDAPALHLPVPSGLKLDQVEARLGSLQRPPMALTLSGMSFAKASPEGALKQLETCLRLISAAMAPARHQGPAQAACF